MEHGVLLGRIEAILGRHELADGDAAEVPAVRVGDRADFLLRLGERHVEHWLAFSRPLEQELESQRRLARARHAFEEIQAVRRKAAAQDVVESGYGGGCKRRERTRLCWRALHGAKVYRTARADSCSETTTKNWLVLGRRLLLDEGVHAQAALIVREAGGDDAARELVCLGEVEVHLLIEAALAGGDRGRRL